jgi:hypothetical protein
MKKTGNNSAVVRKIATVEKEDDVIFLREAVRNAGGSIVKELPLVRGFLCEFPGEGDALLAVRGLEDKFSLEDDVEFKLCCLADFWQPFFTPFAPYFGQPFQQPPQQGSPAPFIPIKTGRKIDWGLKRIGAPEVWGKLKDQRVRVGVIDTGISLNHPDLQSNIKDGISTLEGFRSYNDDYGHGTHAAGIIAACNPNGMVGINPYTDLYIVKAFNNKGSGKLSAIIEGLDWLIRRQVSIINMSFSTSEASSSLERVLDQADQKGILLVAAAGNDGKGVNFPAKYPAVVAVSAVDNKDQLAKFSSYGPEIDFCAPGVDINSTWLQGYAVKSGTSFSAPHIAGTAAVMLNYYGMMPPAQAYEIMSRNAVRLAKMSALQQGAGLVELPRIIG